MMSERSGGARVCGGAHVVAAYAVVSPGARAHLCVSRARTQIHTHAHNSREQALLTPRTLPPNAPSPSPPLRRHAHAHNDPCCRDTVGHSVVYTYTRPARFWGRHVLRQPKRNENSRVQCNAAAAFTGRVRAAKPARTDRDGGEDEERAISRAGFQSFAKRQFSICLRSTD